MGILLELEITARDLGPLLTARTRRPAVNRGGRAVQMRTCVVQGWESV